MNRAFRLTATSEGSFPVLKHAGHLIRSVACHGGDIASRRRLREIVSLLRSWRYPDVRFPYSGCTRYAVYSIRLLSRSPADYLPQGGPGLEPGIVDTQERHPWRRASPVFGNPGPGVPLSGAHAGRVVPRGVAMGRLRTRLKENGEEPARITTVVPFDVTLISEVKRVKRKSQ